MVDGLVGVPGQVSEQVLGQAPEQAPEQDSLSDLSAEEKSKLEEQKTLIQVRKSHFNRNMLIIILSLCAIIIFINLAFTKLNSEVITRYSSYTHILPGDPVSFAASGLMGSEDKLEELLTKSLSYSDTIKAINLINECYSLDLSIYQPFNKLSKTGSYIIVKDIFNGPWDGKIAFHRLIFDNKLKSIDLSLYEVTTSSLESISSATYKFWIVELESEEYVGWNVNVSFK